MSAFLSLKDFCGEGNAGEKRQNLRELFKLAADLRGRLREQGYLVDTHLRMLLSVAEKIPLTMVSEDGHHAASELRGIIRYALWGEGNGEEHPLYKKAKEYIDNHPVHLQEKYTQQSFHFISLFGEFLEYKTQEYQGELEEHIQMYAPFDQIRLQEHRQKLCGLLGGEADVGRLEDLFRDCFLPVAPMVSFVQGLTSALLYELLFQDDESSRLVFQLVLDDIPDNAV